MLPLSEMQYSDSWPEGLAEAIVAAAVSQSHPDGAPFQSIDGASIRRLAHQFRLQDRLVEICALEQQLLPLRYARNQQTLGWNDQIRLLRASVTVVGVGGLGETVCEILARAGVGRLRIYDPDFFAEHNLNRQLYCTADTLGKSKAEAVRQRLATVNRSVEVEAHCQALEVGPARHFLAASDVIVDCLDNLPDRLMVEDVAKKLQTPLVSAAIAGAAGHVTTIFPEDHGLAGVFGEPNAVPQKGAETFLGCLPQAVMLLAALECSEVIKMITGRGSLLRNQLLVVDLMDNTMERISLKQGLDVL